MAKLLTKLVSNLPNAIYESFAVDGVLVAKLALDSRLVGKGALFFAVEGQQFSADEFVLQAIENGAVAICCDKRNSAEVLAVLPAEFPLVIIENLPFAMSSIASAFYDQPSKDMRVLAITGTDGKTSVSHYIAQVFSGSAVIGTIGNGALHQLQFASHTTPNAIELQQLLMQFKTEGVKTVSMEASSHGLSQGRMAAINVDTAVLTNLSRDHLDYHGSLSAYKQAKALLFTDFNAKNIVVNYDDSFGLELYKQFIQDRSCNVIAYTLNAENSNKNLLKAELLQVNATGFELNLTYQANTQTVRLNLLGTFNIENAMATLAALLASGESFFHACQKIEKLQSIKGRMQCITVNDETTVVIDYAHTPQALHAAIKALKLHCDGKIICVFGCGGDRDKGKRPLMAKAASHADYIVVTNDNPRTENPESIVEDICQGFSGSEQYQIEHDRKQAIYLAMQRAKQADVVLIAGKGHEDYQLIGKEKIFFSDEAVVNEYIGEAA